MLRWSREESPKKIVKILLLRNVILGIEDFISKVLDIK